MKPVLLSIILAALFMGCLQAENSSSLDEFYGETDTDFAAVKSVIYENCSSCHMYHSMSVDMLVDAGLIILGDAANSPLYYRIKNSLGVNGPKNMPTVGTINPTELMLIESWISSL